MTYQEWKEIVAAVDAGQTLTTEQVHRLVADVTMLRADLGDCMRRLLLALRAAR